jgi:hypothetical protein
MHGLVHNFSPQAYRAAFGIRRVAGKIFESGNVAANCFALLSFRLFCTSELPNCNIVLAIWANLGPRMCKHYVLYLFNFPFSLLPSTISFFPFSYLKQMKDIIQLKLLNCASCIDAQYFYHYFWTPTFPRGSLIGAISGLGTGNLSGIGECFRQLYHIGPLCLLVQR